MLEFQPCSYLDKEGFRPHYVRFAVYRKNFEIRIDCEITVYHDSSFSINVYDGAYGRTKYAPWYLNDDTEIIKKIKRIIKKKIKELGLNDTKLIN